MVYVFDRVRSKMQNSFCPACVPVKYGFQIRSLIEHNRLPSWKFSEQNENEIIYQSVDSLLFKKQNASSSNIQPINNSLSNRTNVPVVHRPSLITQIQHRWIHLLLNNRLSKEQDDRQLSSVVHQSSHRTSIAVGKKGSSGRSNNPLRIKIERRPRCATFDEYLQRYNRSPLCLTSTRKFHQQ